MGIFGQYDENLVEELRAFFFARDRDITMQSGRDIVLEDGTDISSALGAQFVVLAITGSLDNERRLVAGKGLGLADGGAGGDATLTVDESDVDGLAAEFVVISTTGNLANERQLAAGDGLDLTDGGAGSNATLDVDVTDFIDTAAGLTETTNDIQVNLGTGLSFDGGGAIQVVATTGHIVQEEGGDLAQETYLNFIGAFVTASDNAANSATDVEILQDTQTANEFLAGPASGAPAIPAFRVIVADDLGTPTDDYVLVADSLQANGMRWADGVEIGGVPSGGVIFWPSTAGAVPAGWTTFSAANGRFLAGADGATFVDGATGGAEEVDLSHSHGPGTLATDSDAHSHGAGTLDTDNDSHSHGSGTLDTDNDSHSHTADGTLATDSDSHSHTDGTLATDSDAHSHQLVETAGPVGGGTSLDRNTDSDSHSHSVNSGSTASDSHSHDVTGSTDSDSHDHAVDTGSTASDSHDHAVDAGTTASDSHSHAVDSGSTDTALSATQSILPPFLVGTWIQRS